MRRRRHSEEMASEADINITPLLDIVFIMLIFFVVTTSFIKEAGIEVNRPTAQTSERKEHASILIAITPSGEIWIDRRAAIERLRAENPEGAVVIQGDREAQIGLLVQVMDQVRKAGVSNVSIAATPGE